MTETFSIIPGQIRMVWMAIPVVVMIVALGGLFFSFAGARNAKFEVSPAGLRLRGDFYGRLIPANSIRLDAARAVNLRNEPGLAPAVRTVGTAVGGYRAGWFRLRDGEKALLYVTDPTRVAYVPTANGYAVLLSVADPDALLAALRNAIGPS
jgi:hypothetical protein